MQLSALPGLPLVVPGDDVLALIVDGLRAGDLSLRDGDVLVIAQKIISKSENCYVDLKRVSASQQACKLALEVDKDPRLVELILQQSNEIVRQRPGVIIVEHKLGYVHANAGIDRSNIDGDEDTVLLLPKDADASAAHLRKRIADELGLDVYIIINDSAGRAWREGAIGFALGTAGFEPLIDLVGKQDLMGRPMQVTSVAVADELAAAASFLMGQSNEGAPVVLVSGAELMPSAAGSAALIRERAADMFR